MYLLIILFPLFSAKDCSNVILLYSFLAFQLNIEKTSSFNKIKEDYNSKSGEEQAQTLQKNLQSLEKWSSEKEKETANKSTWKKIGTVISSCLSLVGAKIAGKETENIKNNLAQAMKELKTGGKKEVGEWVSKIKQEATKNQERTR